MPPVTTKPTEIKVTNSGDSSIEVCINQWGDDGDTDFFTIRPNHTETWGRSDLRGFIMGSKKHGASNANTNFSYVTAGSVLYVQEDGSIRDIIQPLENPYPYDPGDVDNTEDATETAAAD